MLVMRGVWIMRTTIAVDDQLLAVAKERAHAQQMTLGQLVEQALRRELGRHAADATRPVVPVFTGGSGPCPGVDVTSTRGLIEALDRDLPLEQLR